MARKNGKTGLVAPIALYGLTCEGEGAEVYSCAADRDQAKLVFTAAKRTAELSPDLSGRIKPYRDVLEDKQTGSIYRALSSEAFTKEGLSPTLVIADELHAWPNRELYDVMALAMGARPDPLMLIVTTAGVRSDTSGGDSIAYTLYQYGKRLASSEVSDPSFYFAWWEAPSGCALDDLPAWEEANPGVGDILDRDELANQLKRAMVGGMAEAEARVKRGNQWVNSATSWMPIARFEDLAVKDGRRLKPKEAVVLGFDGSFNHDCTALVAVTLDGFIQVLELWEQPIDQPGWEVPYDEVDVAVRKACRDYDVKEIAADPFRWAQVIQGWQMAGLPAEDFQTSSPARMVPACAKFYDAVIDKRLSHSGDPALVRHIGNCVIKTDARYGPRIVKEHRSSPRKIDLAVAAVAAYDRATWWAEEMKRPRTGGWGFLA